MAARDPDDAGQEPASQVTVADSAKARSEKGRAERRSGDRGSEDRAEPTGDAAGGVGGDDDEGDAGPPSFERGKMVGRYVVLEELGAGGMGVVYAAWDPELGRRVALKLVDPSDSGTYGRTRIQREAQALARLSHPNVVTIYDVGTIDGRVFLAMELVEGPTLGKWMETRHPVREVMSVLAAAGRGLAAAHAAGIVHRDFKPNNVILGNDGRVRVLDFGIARAGGQEFERPATVPEASKYDSLDVQLTQAGSLIGTPAYMAPEGLRTETVTEAGDQFSFCMVFYEALYGDAPFDHVFTDKLPAIAAPPPDSKVPAWVRRILVRGLSERIEDRYPSMAELLAALDDDPAIKYRKWLLGVAGAAVIVTIALLALKLHNAPKPYDVCSERPALAGVWNADARQRVQSALGAGGADNAKLAVGALDEAATQWMGARREACADTRKRHTQSEPLLLRRLECLDREKEDLAAIIDVLSDPKRGGAADAAQAVRELPGPALCANARALSYVEPPLFTVAARVADVRARLSKARALLLIGKEDEAGKQLSTLVAESQQIGYLPLLADAQYLAGRQQLDDFTKSIALLDGAERTAIACQADNIAARAASMRLAQGAIEGRADAVLDDWTARAQAWVERNGDLEAEFGLVESLGILAAHRGDHVAAAEHLRHAIELGTKEFGAASARVFGVQASLAFTLIQLGKYDEATSLLGGAIATFERANGSTSERLRDALDNYGLALAMIGRYAEARTALERALSIGSEEGMVRAALQCDLARVALGEGRIDDAIASGEQGIALFKKLHVEKINLAINEDPLAGAYAAANRPADALAQSRECLGEFAKASNEGLDTVPCLVIEGAAQIDLGKPTAGLAVLERAYALQTGHAAAPGVNANIEYQLARALVASGDDLERAKKLIERAREELAKYPFLSRRLAEVDAWRAKNGM